MDRKSLLVTTALIGMSLAGYGRRAYGACSAVGAAVTCSGSSAANTTTQSFSPLDNAAVTVSAGFGVNAGAGNGITVTGDGALSFSDTNTVNSVDITANAGGGKGIYMYATGDAGGTPGSINFYSNSAVRGNNKAIELYNNGTGDMTVVVNGDVTSTASYGMYLTTTANTGNFDLTIGSTSTITAGGQGINAYIEGAGTNTIVINGDINAPSDKAFYIFTTNNVTALNVTIGEESTLTGGKGVDIRNYGSNADTTIVVNGDITSTTDRDGLFSYVMTGAGGNNVTVGADARIIANGAGDNGLYLYTKGSAASRSRLNFQGYAKGTYTGISLYTGTVAAQNSYITTYNDATVIASAGSGIDARSGKANIILSIGDNTTVTGTNEGIYALSGAAGIGITVTTDAGTTVTGGDNGLETKNYGIGATAITVNGDVTTTGGDGIHAYGDASTTNMSVTTGSGSTVTGTDDAIFTDNRGSGATTLAISGDVTTTGGDGIHAYGDASTTNMSVTTGSGSTVTGTDDAIFTDNRGSGATSIAISGDVTTTGGDGIHAYGDASTTNMSVTTGSGSTVTGTDDAIFTDNRGSGATTLAISGDVTATTGNAIDIRQPNSASAVTLTIDNGATVRSNGTTAIVTDAGKVLNLSIDSGSVIGTGGTAADLGDGDDSVTVSGTVNFTGDIEGGAGTDTLNIGTTTLNATSGSSFLNFEDANITGTLTSKAGNLVDIQSTTAVDVTGSLVVGVTDATTFGKLAGSSGVAFSNGAGITVDATGIGTIPSGTTLSSVVSGGTISGITSGTLSDNSPAYKFTSVVNADSVDVLVERPIATSGTGKTASFVRALDSASLASSNSALRSLVATLVDYPDDAQRSAAIKTLIPESDNARFNLVKTAGQKSFNITQTRMDKVRHAGTSGISTGSSQRTKATWMSLFGKDITQGYRDGQSGYDAKMSGVVGGLDVTFREKTIVGVAFSYVESASESRSGDSEVEVQAQSATVYLSHDFGDSLYMELQALGGLSKMKSDRTLFDNSHAVGNYDGRQFSMGASLGYGMKVKNADVTPFISAEYQYIWHDDYREKGGSLPLSVDETRFRSLESEVGVKVAYPFVYRDTKYIPHAALSWKHNMFNDDTVTHLSFAAESGTRFSSVASSSGADMLNLGLGLEVEATDSLILSLDYNLEAQKEFRAHSGLLKAKMDF